MEKNTYYVIPEIFFLTFLVERKLSGISLIILQEILVCRRWAYLTGMKILVGQRNLKSKPVISSHDNSWRKPKLGKLNEANKMLQIL